MKSNEPAPETDRRLAREIEWDCIQALVRFYDHFDRWDYAGMAALFTPDGVWHRAGKALTGRAAIVAELEQRPRTQKVRHVLSNLLAEVRDARQAELHCYLTVYRHDGGEAREGPAVIRSPALFLVVSASMVRTDEGWRIARQVMQREFEFA